VYAVAGSARCNAFVGTYMLTIHFCECTIEHLPLFATLPRSCRTVKFAAKARVLPAVISTCISLKRLFSLRCERNGVPIPSHTNKM